MVSILILVVILIALIGIPIFLTILNVVYFFTSKKKWKAKSEMATIVLGVFYTIILYGMWDMKEWSEALSIGGGELVYHTFISGEHVKTFLIFSVLAIVGYSTLRIRKTKLPPLVIILCMSCMYIGCGLSCIWIVQIWENLFEAYVIIPVEAGFMILFPVNFIILSISAIKEIILEKSIILEREEAYGRFGVLRGIINESKNWPLVAFFLIIPVLGICTMFLILFGQEPDALLKAFTETSDWTFSTKISPQPVNYDGHYLCTVAAGGDEKIVKPQRMGIRHGNRIIVNRQLCVANAFEEILNEKTPRFHHFIRHIYDKYGYPIAKHIKTPLAADFTYLVMKPLEWIFVIVLYLCDQKPENRIASQYLPLKKKER